MEIDTILGERLNLASAQQVPPKLNAKGQRVVTTVTGREVAADLIVGYILRRCPRH